MISTAQAKELLERTDCTEDQVRQLKEFIKANPRFLVEPKLVDWLKAHRDLINAMYKKETL